MTPKITIPDNLKEVKGCVFKLYYGNHYIVLMCNLLVRQIESIAGDINRFENKVKSSMSAERLYWNFCWYISNHPNEEFKIDILLQSESPYQLLKRCQIEIDESLADELCLNNNIIPFLSRRIQTPKYFWDKVVPKIYGEYKYWINRGHYLNFRKWQYSRYVI